MRQWLKAYRTEQQTERARPAEDSPASEAVKTLVPVSVQTTGDIQIEIRRQQTAFQIAWPISHAQACAAWLRDVMK